MTTLLNTAILLLSLSATWLLLWSASHLSLGYALLAAWLFSLVNNTPFALMHEAVHGVASRSPRLNRLLGVVAGWAFPTSFLMQRTAHIDHHQRNRTDEELYDYYLPHQSRRVRNLWLYAGNLFGLYWVSVVAGNLVYLVAPWAYRSRFFAQRPAPALGFGPYVANLVKLPAATVLAGDCAGLRLPGPAVSLAGPEPVGHRPVLLGICPALVDPAVRRSCLERTRPADGPPGICVSCRSHAGWR
ncbi:fatty acid desaturase [Malikia spinosa]|uniref:fatty acid desaturase n=1 Tax=Malikia spinosa TaxID=86180 RepID=UPI001B8080A5|nr:fatty acid desaturase [Malikia spinosa]